MANSPSTPTTAAPSASPPAKLGTVATRLATVDDNTATITTWTEVIP